MRGELADGAFRSRSFTAERSDGAFRAARLSSLYSQPRNPRAAVLVLGGVQAAVLVAAVVFAHGGGRVVRGRGLGADRAVARSGIHGQGRAGRARRVPVGVGAIGEVIPVLSYAIHMCE